MAKDALRSFLRTREAWWRKHPQPDAHVRLYMATFNPTQRALWSCLHCGSVIRGLDRPRDRDGRLKAHCGCANLVTLTMTPDQLKAHKRQARIDLKRKYRRQQGARLRVDIAAKARVKRAAAALAKKRRKAARPHDAHVKRYLYLKKAKEKAFIRYHGKENYRERLRLSREQLTDGYISKKLAAMGIARNERTDRLIELKREQMTLRRLSLELKHAARKINKERYESINKHT